MANAYRLSARWMGALAVAASLAACVPVDRPHPWAQITSVELAKQDIASQRNRGLISYEQAAREQFEIERAAYALNEQELGIWRTAIVYASQYDHRQITLADYRQRTAALFKDYNVRR